MRQRSKKKAAEDRQRKKLAEELRQLRGMLCEARTEVCTSLWTDMHEVLRRSQGGSAVDPGNILCVCRSCHDWIHNNVAEAKKRGLLKSRGEE